MSQSPKTAALLSALAIAGWHPAAHAAEVHKAANDTADPNRHRCAWRSDIIGFSVLDDRHFLLRTGPRGRFLATLTPGCAGLKLETRIALQGGPASGPCVDRGDRVTLDTHQSCVIWKIEYVKSREAAAALVAARKKAEAEGGK